MTILFNAEAERRLVKIAELPLSDPDPRNSPLAMRCTEIADQAVPRYRQQEPYPSCTGHIAKQWQAAWDGACIALGGDPTEYLG